MENKQQIIQELSKLLSEGERVRSQTRDFMGVVKCNYSMFRGWKSSILTTLEHLGLNNTEHYKCVNKMSPGSVFPSDVDIFIQQLKSLKDMVEKDFVSPGSVKTMPSLEDLENIFNKFTKVARQLNTRHDDRDTLTISDEYDVQDLLHALLLLHFDDVRAEEWTPSYAGGCERMDFLLKDLQTVIEVKKTRPKMTMKSLGEELIIDIEKYKVHPDCKQLYCFVYDPDYILGNPNAIRNDLEKSHEGFVKIFIRPEM